MLPDLIKLTYLLIAAYIGLSHSSSNVLLFFGIGSLSALTAMILMRRNDRLRNGLLFCLIPLTGLSIYQVYWPLISLVALALVISVFILSALLVALTRGVSARTVQIGLALSVPFVLYFSVSAHDALLTVSNEWRLVAEEGQILGWVTRVMHGQVPFRDFVATRGPFILYSTAAVFSIFGESMLMKRSWFFAADLGMAFFYLLFCRTFFRSKTLGWFAFFMMFLIHKFNYRTGFGVASMALFWIAYDRRSRKWAAAAGIAVALSLLSSIEVGACAILSLVVTGLAGIGLQPSERGKYASILLVSLAGVVVILAPILGYFWILGQLQDVITGIVVYPRFAMLGYAATPFPNLITIFAYEAETGNYWFTITQKVFWLWSLPILAYLFTFFIWMKSALNRKLNQRKMMLLHVAVYGWLLFRSALGRSDYHHLYFAIPPAFALILLLADWRKENFEWKELPKHPSVAFPVVIACLIPVIALLQRAEDRLIPLARQTGAVLQGRSPVNNRKVATFTLDRMNGIVADRRIQKRMEAVYHTIDSVRKPQDKIYAFPNLPIYYFLFDSPNPTRYEWAYQAITTEMRKDVVRSLQVSQPEFIIYSVDYRQRLDRIGYKQAVPEIVQYIQSHYKRWQIVGKEEILVPLESTLQPELNKPVEIKDEPFTEEPGSGSFGDEP